MAPTLASLPAITRIPRASASREAGHGDARADETVVPIDVGAHAVDERRRDLRESAGARRAREVVPDPRVHGPAEADERDRDGVRLRADAEGDDRVIGGDAQGGAADAARRGGRPLDDDAELHELGHEPRDGGAVEPRRRAEMRSRERAVGMDQLQDGGEVLGAHLFVGGARGARARGGSGHVVLVLHRPVTLPVTARLS
jgi:hypothetical protein